MSVAPRLLAGLLALLVLSPAPTVAQQWPTRTVTFIIPFAAGGPGDVVGRLLGERLSIILGQQVIIENVGGVGGMAGGNRVAKGAPDGNSFVLGTVGTHAMSQTLYARPLYDSVKEFVPVVLINEVPLLLTVRKTLPANDLREFIAYAKANPGKLNFGTGGVGSASHLACVLLSTTAGISTVHVSYRGGGPAMNDLISGQIDFMCEATSTAVPHVEAGSTKALANLTGKRSSVLPDLATADEQGLPGFDVSSWYALFMHAATPDYIVQRLRAATLQATASVEVRSKLEPLGITMIGPERNSSEYLARFLKDEIEKWAAPIKSSGSQIK